MSKRRLRPTIQWCEVTSMNQENEITASLTETQVRSISERKRVANCQNARRSTGLRTEAGKGRSRWNAIKHGLLVKDVPANHWPYFYDDLESFQLLMEDLVDHFDPVGPVEGMLIERIGQCYWGSHRFQLVENATIRLDLVRESLPRLDGFQGIKDTGSRLDLMGESLPRSDPERNSRERDNPDIQRLFERARRSIERLGYVEAALQMRILEEPYYLHEGERFVAANEEAQELVRAGESCQCPTGLTIQMKKARSRLLCQLDECELSSQRSNDRIEEILRETQRARYAQHLAPCNLLRYETTNQRQLYSALHELERLQALRRGDDVAPKRRFST
jgi:hypothetical protein